MSDLLAAPGDRATAALLFVSALPNVLLAPPGTFTAPRAPLVFLAAQPMLGRAPWLPRAESLLCPRLGALARRSNAHLIGLAWAAVSVVSGVVFAMAKAGAYFFAQVVS